MSASACKYDALMIFHLFVVIDVSIALRLIKENNEDTSNNAVQSNNILLKCNTTRKFPQFVDRKGIQLEINRIQTIHRA